MQGRDISDEKVSDLVAYVRSLPPAPALGMIVGAVDTPAVERGRGVFQREHCHRCHAPPAYTSPATYDVGLKDELGQSKFNPPSLRGVSQRDALFHDNRAASLEEVFRKFRHQIREGLTASDLSDLVQFLLSL
jgi:mono/diheme cytochrome c family protein